MLMRKPMNRVLALLLAVLMIFSQATVTVSAKDMKNGTAGGIITAFGALEKDVADQNVSVGTPQSALALPDSLEAAVDGETGIVTGIIWQIEPEYDGSRPDTYIFTAVLPGDYTVQDGLELPVINVTVEAIETEEDGSSNIPVPESIPGQTDEPAPNIFDSPANEQTDRPLSVQKVMPEVLILDQIQPFARGDYFQYGNVWYKVLSEGMDSYTVEVTSDEDRNQGYSGALTIPATVSNGGSSYDVVSIADSAFYNCKGITSLDLSGASKLTSIGRFAFFNCSGIKGTLTIPSGVISIGNYAFYDCSGFEGALTIPSGVTSISDRAFSGCSGFKGTLTIPQDVTSIGKYAFYGCKGLEGTLNIPTGVIRIDREAFSGCSGFEGKLTIPAGVTSISDNAFTGCSGFTSLELPDKLDSIGQAAFKDCSGFKGTLTIPAGVTTIGRDAFYGCSGFEGTLTLPAGLTSIDHYVFYGCSGFEGTLTIPSGVISIGQAAFSGCSGFEGVLVIPPGVTKIGYKAFAGTGSITVFIFTGATAPMMSDTIGWSGTSYYPVLAEGSYLSQTGMPKPAYPYSSPAVAGPADQTVADGSTADFHVTVTDGAGPYTYHWRVYDSQADANADTDGTGGTLVSDGGPYSGAETATLMVTATAEVVCKYYKCFVKDSFYPDLLEAAVSQTAKLTVEYNVIYKDHFGNDIINLPRGYDNARSYVSGTGLSIPGDEPYSRTGYTFEGWYDALTGGSKVTDISNTAVGDVILYARWKDVTPPTGEIKVKENSFASFLDTITFGLFFKNTLDVSITATDNEGVQLIQYYLSNEVLSITTDWDAVSWVTGDSATITNNWKGIIYARFTDTAGNKTIISSNGIVVYADSDASVDGGSFSKGSAEDLEVTFTMNSNKVKSITIDGATLIKETDYILDYTKDGTIIFKNAYLKNLKDGMYKFNVSWYPLGETGELTDGDVPGTTTITVAVCKSDQDTLSITGMPDVVTYGDDGFTLKTDGGSSTGLVTFSVPNNDVIHITTDGTVTIRSAGTVTVTAEKDGDNNYHAVKATLDIKVLPRDISKASVIVTGSRVYTGSQIRPVFTVSDGTQFIDTGDYTCTYGDNITVAQGGSITLTGQRNYTGTKKVSFDIIKASPAKIVFPTADAVTYASDKTLADVTLTGGTGDGTFAWQNDSIIPSVNNSGYLVVFTPDDADNYDYSGVTLMETVVLTVNKADQVLTGLPDLVKINHGANFTVTPNSSASAENPEITFLSDDTSVINVDTDGNFVIKGDGTANITVSAAETANYKSTTASFKILVLADTTGLKELTAAAEDLLNSLDTDDIGNGNAQYPENAVNKFRDSIDAAKAVADDDAVTQAEVSWAKEELLKAIEEFQNSLILKSVTGVTLDQSNAKVTAGKTRKLTAVVTPADAADQNLIWSSSDTSIAVVDATGKVTGIKAGSVLITVTTKDGGYTATCKVTVTAADTSGTDTSSSVKDSVMSGDDHNIWLWISLLVASALAFLGLYRNRKRERYVKK